MGRGLIFEGGLFSENTVLIYSLAPLLACTPYCSLISYIARRLLSADMTYLFVSLCMLSCV